MTKESAKYKVQSAKPMMGVVLFVCGMFFVVPVFSQGLLTDQLDEHLEQFETFVPTGIPVDDLEESETVEIRPLTEEELKTEIVLEEDALSELEEQLRSVEVELWQTAQEKGTIEAQIQALDQELNLIKQQLPVYEEQERVLRDELAILTRDKSDLEALLRVRQREYDRLAVRNFLRTDNWQGRAEPNIEPSTRLFLLRWLFSDRSLSDVIADYHQQEAFQRNQQESLQQLKVLREQVSASEKQVARRYAVASDLSQQISRHKSNLGQFTDAKAELRNRLLLDQQSLEDQLITYRQQQADSTVLLQELRQSLKKGSPVVPLQDSVPTNTADVPFVFPLEGDMRVTAYFHDRAYEQQFGVRHDAVDFAAPQGSSVLAVRDGIVSKVEDNGLGYSYVIVEHSNDTFTLYGHVSSFFVQEGQRVSQGDVIALSGGTPGTKGAGYFTTGPHLHFEVFKDGRYIDPLLILPEIE